MDQISIIVPGKQDTIIALTKAEKMTSLKMALLLLNKEKCVRPLSQTYITTKFQNLKLDIYAYTGFYNLRVTFLTIYNFLHFQVVLDRPQSLFYSYLNKFQSQAGLAM